MKCVTGLRFDNRVCYHSAILMSSEPDINKLLMRSAELEEILCDFFSLTFNSRCHRTLASRIMCNVVYDHARSVKILTAAGNYTSAFGLYRLQYEALVRAFWLMFAASDQWVSTLMTDVTPEGEKKANNLPSASEMVAALEGKAPEVAVTMLLDFKAQVWKLLCSFVHGGFHALHRQGGGYPPILVSQVLKGSNGLCVMAGNVLVMLSRDNTQAGRIGDIQKRFADYLPEPKPDAQ